MLSIRPLWRPEINLTYDAEKMYRSIEEWFSHIGYSFKEAKRNKTTVVYILGNESVDLDSTVSAITLALFLGFLYQEKKARSTEGELSNVIFIPFINGTRQKFSANNINARYIQLCGVSWNDLNLLYFDDDPSCGSETYSGNVPKDAFEHPKSQCSHETEAVTSPYVILVDHNNITDMNYPFYKSGRVICVIDHHVDSDIDLKRDTKSWKVLKQPDQFNPLIRDLIPTEWVYSVAGPCIGSCCTLIAELILSTVAPNIFATGVGTTLANLLLVTILKDTECLRADFKGIRWNERDSKVVDLLTPKSSWPTESLLTECKTIIHNVQTEWKFSLATNAKLEFLIRNDLKWFRYDNIHLRYPFASVPIPLAQPSSSVTKIAKDLIQTMYDLYCEERATHKNDQPNKNINYGNSSIPSRQTGADCHIMAILSREDDEHGSMIKRLFIFIEELIPGGLVNEMNISIGNRIETLMSSTGGTNETTFHHGNCCIYVYSIPLYMSRKVVEPLIRQVLIN